MTNVSHKKLPDKDSPLPWMHFTEAHGRKHTISAIIDNNEHVVCGSLLSYSSKNDRKNREFIMECVNQYVTQNKLI